MVKNVIIIPVKPLITAQTQQSNLITKPLRIILQDVHVVNQDRAALAIVEALNEVDEGRLSAARGSHERECLAGRKVDGQAVHDLDIT